MSKEIDNGTVDITLQMKIPSVTAQQIGLGVTRTGRPYTYKQKRVQRAETEFGAKLIPHRIKQPHESAVKLMIAWFYNTKDKQKIGTFKQTRPDLDNLNKILQDMIVKVGFIKDDNLIAVLNTQKKWTDQGDHIKIRIEPLGGKA